MPAGDTLVCIPTWFGLEQIGESVREAYSCDRVSEVFITSNNPACDERLLQKLAPQAYVVPRAAVPPSLYGMWNRFAGWAATSSRRLLLVNDDVQLSLQVVAALNAVLDGNDGLSAVSVGPWQAATDVASAYAVRPAKGSSRQGGMNGWCFLLREGVWPAEGIDEGYRVWYGDDDLWWKLDNEGHQLAVADGITVRHATSSTVNALPWTAEALSEDSARWAETRRP